MTARKKNKHSYMIFVGGGVQDWQDTLKDAIIVAKELAVERPEEDTLIYSPTHLITLEAKVEKI